VAGKLTRARERLTSSRRSSDMSLRDPLLGGSGASADSLVEAPEEVPDDEVPAPDIGADCKGYETGWSDLLKVRASERSERKKSSAGSAKVIEEGASRS
jgi:hypothetical protein